MVEISQNQVGKATVIKLIGNLDNSNVSVLREYVQKEVNYGNYFIVLDIGGVEYMDSSGLGQLVAALKMSKNHGGDVVLSCVNDEILSTMKITRLDTLFLITKTVEEGVKKYDDDQPK